MMIERASEKNLHDLVWMVDFVKPERESQNSQNRDHEDTAFISFQQ